MRGHLRPFGAALGVVLLSPVAASAHAPAGDAAASAWSLSPWLLVPGMVALALYLAGLLRLWRRAGIGRGVEVRQVVAFAAGVGVLFLALVWPLDALGAWSLAAHMGQHMLLLALAPPLLLLGRPLAVLAQALPGAWPGRMHRAGAPAWRHLRLRLAVATAVHCAVMLAWHLPSATAAALGHEGLHWAMHGSFLLAGLWYWSVLLQGIREREAGVGPGLVSIVAVMMAMGLLGALLVFAPRPLYPVYVERAPMLGLDALADQQLAGLVMWIPSALPYLAGGLWLATLGLRWLDRESPARRGSQ